MKQKLRTTRNCVVWTRVSTSKQETNGGSLDYQKKICERYAKEHRLNIVGYYGGTHESAKEMGKLCRDMIKVVKKDISISKIICSQFDRLSRNRGEAIVLMDKLRTMGVTIIEATTGTETSDATTALLACFKFSTATLDNEIREDKFYAGRKHCYESGAYIGVLPRGYVREGKSLNSVCKLNDEGRLIAKAFRWKLDGFSNTEILEMLSRLGLTIDKKSLNHYFNNPFYAGKIQSKMLDEGMVDGHIEQAVSYQDWLKIQEIMSNQTGWYKHKKKNEVFPLKNFVRCADCGTRLTAYTVKAKHRDYYKCNKVGCRTNMSADIMHEEFYHVLKELDLPIEFYEQYENLIMQLLHKDGDERQERLSLLKKHRTEKQNELEQCKTRFAIGKISEELYESVSSKLEAEVAQIDAELEKCKENLSNLEKDVRDILVSCSKLSDLWKEADLETKQRIQKLLFPEDIFWDKENRHYRTENRNPIYDVFDEISVSYGHKKETDSEEPVSSCAG